MYVRNGPFAFQLLSDGIGMVSSLEWSEEFEGERKPRICSFGNGVIIYCPNGEFKVSILFIMHPLSALTLGAFGF